MLSPEGLMFQTPRRQLHTANSRAQKANHRAKGAIRAEDVVTTAVIRKCYCDLSQIRGKGMSRLSKKDLRKDQQEVPLDNLTEMARAGICN